ncbi:MAG: carboxypeptidase regulatory-like domain-containing protein [Planctomycetaceae bacterium]
MTLVTGTVKLKGKPLADAIVILEPDAGGPASTGRTDAEGKFEVQYDADHKGAVPGVHLVRVTKMDGEAGAEQVPEKFNSRSELLVSVEDPGPTELTIEL